MSYLECVSRSRLGVEEVLLGGVWRTATRVFMGDGGGEGLHWVMAAITNEDCHCLG